MARRKIEDIVAGLVEPIIQANDFELVDIEFVKEAGNWYLRVYIDKPGGITIDDCQVVSEELSGRLDETDPIEQSYFLEVSSPGLERPLKKDRDFVKYRGEVVEVKLYQAIDGKKVYEGELQGLVEGEVIIKAEADQIMSFDRNTISTVRRVIKF